MGKCQIMVGKIWKQKLISWLAILFLANALHSSNSARILGIFADPAKSHFNFNKQIMYTLAKAGHQVTFVSPFQEPNAPANFTYIVPQKRSTDDFDFMKTDLKSISLVQHFRIFRRVHSSFWSDSMKIPEIQNFSKSKIKMYDILFVELVPLYECILPLAEKLKIPVVGTLSFRFPAYVSEFLGNSNPFGQSTIWFPLPKKMGFFQRLQNVFGILYENLIVTYILKPSLVTFYNENFPKFETPRNRDISVLFASNHASLFPSQLTTKVIDVAGIHLTPIKPLPQTLEKFINESKYGVILLSFGSISRSNNIVDTRLINVLRETFRCLRQRVIWKFEKNLENIPENVLIWDWIPQRDILAHKNVKVFISHSGMNGMYEAIDAGVPIVSIPLVFDQLSNAALIEEFGIGVRLDFKTLSKEILLGAINDVLYNERYFKQMQKISTEFKDRPMSPKESIVYWTEYVLRHNGTKHLESTSAEIPLYQFLLLDLLIFIIFLILTVSLVMKLVYKLIYNVLKNVKN